MATTLPEREPAPGHYGEEAEYKEQESGRVSPEHVREDGKHELLESEAWDKLGYSWPTWRKWQILCVVFLIQISINLNASMYANAVDGISETFDVSKQVARIPQMTFLVAYAFGCELWAPWSEEFGRWPIQQLSLFLVNIWQIPCALAPSYGTYVVVRLLGGLSTAGGSVTLGVLADLWEPNEQEYAVAFLVLSSVGGSVVGAVIGGFVQEYKSLPWIFWVQLMVGAGTQLVHLVCNPETRATILLDREAKRRRKTGEDPNVYGPNELKPRLNMKEIWTIWYRPFYMFFTEPIVTWLSLLSGFSDALIFTFLESFNPVYKQWGFGTIGVSLAFIPLLVGYFLAYFSYLPSIHYFRGIRRKDPDRLTPEARLWWLLFLAPLETIGLFGFAWTSLGPGYGIPWIAPMIFSCLVGMANYAIYQSSIDYQTAAYGPYAASATGGNDLARDFLAGIAALYATPMYSNIPGRPLEYASTILACIAVVVTIPIYIFYWKGPEIRARSKFAESLDKSRKKSVVARKSLAGIDEKHLPGRRSTSGAQHVEAV
ncbi:major facilitator superfamily domain-containing protein [Lineolata rhizophorae]|uniref:Major facilitator superfamily domain-containing protein n=1 Tax=Lineolata rhizophorae TaxID=578093 RepID=A0A6A6P4F8_9PEZI|nr:major facilitator superfamily domain-containing protein [Lineolata rhizophorae]